MEFVKNRGPGRATERAEEGSRQGNKSLKAGLIATIAGGGIALLSCGPVEMENYVPIPPKNIPDSGVVKDGVVDGGIVKDGASGKDAGIDAKMDKGSDSVADMAPDLPAEEAGKDIGVDSGKDAGVDSAPDMGVDLGPDMGPDTNPDSGVDSGVDAGVDSAPDVGIDEGVDVGVDLNPDMGVDSGTDSSADSGADSALDQGQPDSVLGDGGAGDLGAGCPGVFNQTESDKKFPKYTTVYVGGYGFRYVSSPNANTIKVDITCKSNGAIVSKDQSLGVGSDTSLDMQADKKRITTNVSSKTAWEAVMDVKVENL